MRAKRILMASSKKVTKPINETQKKHMNEQIIILLKDIITIMTMKIARKKTPIT